MAPETRSRGVSAPSRVYHSSPALQQVQFPSRKKKIRRQAASEHKSLKQQTLTQIDFVSSFDGDDDGDGGGDEVIAMSESDDDAGHKSNAPSEDGDKENAPPPCREETVRQSGQTREDEDEELLVSRGRKRAGTSTKEASKRRRTMGDDGDQVKRTARGGEKSRRKTLGQVPPSTNYHTQTLTQFLGHQTSFVADSDDEDKDEGFLSWLGEPEPGSPSAGRGRPRLPSPAKGASAKGAATGANVSRENSVIPQTPAERSTTIRFEIPSGGIQSPSERMMGRYGAPGVQESPLKNRSSPMGPPRQVVNDSGVVTASPSVGGRKPSSIIQDSYTTQGSSTPSKSQSQVRGTPPKPRTALDHGSPTGLKTPKRKNTPSPKKTTTAGLYEIPDSDEDEYIDDNDGEENAVETHETGYGVGIETQAVMGEIASPPPSSTQISRQDPRFPSSTQANVTSTCPRPRPMTSKPMRRPLHHPSTHAQPSQPWESQRVPVSVLQSLPVPSARSDIILPISSTSLESLITGHAIAIATSFKIPSQVVRFWLFENHLLRYMASVEPGEQQQRAPPQSSSQPAWRYHASQVYELNNPVQEQDMLEEGWIDNQITRYSYLPPAVIGQLLWNLRHPLFGDASEEPAPPPPPPPPPGLSSPSSPVQQVAPKDQVDLNAAQLPRHATSPPGSMTVSQQVTAQIHSDMAHSTQLPTSDDTIPSTPDDNQTLQPCPSASKRHHPLPPSSTPREPNQQNIHPSQATTLSQASTPERQPSLQHLATKAPVLPSAPVPFPPPLFNASDNSIQFLDHTDSLSSLPFPSSVSSTSQLLTKSQTLPDSLIQDHAPLAQPEIWDSDDEDVSL
ncbi:hypothetical protein EsDP_00004162 [Epichloe bromicola]|uniref:Uncharacterized protein n=1 Tax=Epichloe bromicola TaxID=79588 RepID=A0ABQ0CQW7_9HYPO